MPKVNRLSLDERAAKRGVTLASILAAEYAVREEQFVSSTKRNCKTEWEIWEMYGSPSALSCPPELNQY